MIESDFIKVANLARIRAAEVIIWQIAPGEGVTKEELTELTSKLEAIAERITGEIKVETQLAGVATLANPTAVLLAAAAKDRSFLETGLTNHFTRRLFMRLLEAITEDEMVAVFLKTEINSVRYSTDILALLRRDKRSRRIIDTPDTRNQEENAYRTRLLGDFRGYKQGRDLFLSFPDDVFWYRAILSREELARVRYIDYSYWNELSGGSRLPTDAATNIRAGKVVFGKSTQGFLNLAWELQRGAKFPELILTGVSPTSDLVVLEGHVRLTTYFLAPHCIPEELQVIVGFSSDFERING